MTGPGARLRSLTVVAAVVVGALGLIGNAADLLSLFASVGLLGTGALIAAAVGVATGVESYRHRNFRRDDEPPRTAGALRIERTVGRIAVVVAVLLGTLALVQSPAMRDSTSEGSAAAPPPAVAGTSPEDLAATPVLGFEFSQEGVRNPIRLRREPDYDVVQVQIAPEPFEISFPRRDPQVPIRLVAWVDRSVFDLQVGRRASDRPSLAPGSGMADGDAPGEIGLMIDREAHNHLAGPRIVDDGPGREKTVYKNINLDGSDDFYLPGASVVVFVDRNGDEVVDLGEFEYLEFQVIRS